MDAHIHSRYSRATSKDLSIKTLEKYARIKGVNLLGTGDFTHPLWLKELKQDLIEDGTGILKTKTGFNFILQTEVSNVYAQNKKLRKIHNIILAKSFDIVDQINELLSKKGNLEADGRPTFGSYSCVELIEDLKKIDENIEIIPAHIWTPWFSLFGSMSGFDSIEECFQDQTRHIHALETGLSSDPGMNWRLSALDNFTLVSNSDLHSYWPWRLGRECNIFELKELTYENLIKAIKTKEGFIETIEVNPSYGKYHFDGHRVCQICMNPEDAIKINNICPRCKRKLTIGVLHRVIELADREEGFIPRNAIPFKSLIPLSELLSHILNASISSKQVWKEYYKIIKEFNTELEALLYAPFDKLRNITDERIAKAIIDNREGRIYIQPGYDGQYGYPVFNKKITKQTKQKQLGLYDF